jgi:molybdopterin molybdotransferase
MIGYREARELVIARVAGLGAVLETESVPLREALGRVLAHDIVSDRDYPPFDRSIRDGYAVRAVDTHPGAQLRCTGEVRAGDTPSIFVSADSCVQIMTGAPLPAGADAVVMIEHISREGDLITLDRGVKNGQHVVRKGSEQAASGIVLVAGTRIGFAEVAAAAQVGAAHPAVTRKPRVAVLSTGDEVVDFWSAPGPFQIRNSNSVSLGAQISLLGGEAVILGNAKDSLDELRRKISAGLEADALILSGGVSMGKYDLVEPVLLEFGAEIIFDAVAIRPGKPVVFAICKGKAVFGLPGNPVSTMVTFDLFVQPAIDILAGAEPRPLPFVRAMLTAPLTERPGLTHFLPAQISWRGETAHVSPIAWQGSGDVVAMAHANCLMVVPSERERIDAGEAVHVLTRGIC